ncbi:hypothetical protein Tmar_0028 [Thermaerobacter marianensis DSM 12885]|uniref:Uncharacterized protein n=1 Tax=Thermaerobacter marianensis (strain ATCC 700841 / DSM 12885 / JCM 10246 / 7p75a) TaxID=644966 RepID=E6SKG6_THEM7|nr:hypothetical protein [Thermaerobacter marianensis]ADU50153.1 hypothetical protein Tmar_0028 [Thermaerobacter marianensis DSM 12885]
MIPIGTEVEWVSQSQGWWTVKRGIVIAHLEPGQPVETVLPPGTDRRHVRGNRISKHRRYVVAVKRPKGKVTYYYTPVAEWLENGVASKDG